MNDAAALAAASLWLRRRWPVLAVAAGLLLTTVATALVVPVRQAAAGGASAQAGIASAFAEGVAEDLTPLLDSVRWGTSLREALAAAAAAQTGGPAAAAPDQVLAEGATDSVRFVGYIASEDHRAALLAFPDGEIVRLEPGENLRDGRAVADISAGALTLGNEGDAAEVLALFPPVPSGPRDDQSPDLPASEELASSNEESR